MYIFGVALLIRVKYNLSSRSLIGFILSLHIQNLIPCRSNLLKKQYFIFYYKLHKIIKEITLFTLCLNIDSNLGKTNLELIVLE